MSDSQQQLNALRASYPWLDALMETTAAAMEASRSEDTCPDWWGRLVRATVSSCSTQPGVSAEDGGWTLSMPMLGTQDVPRLRGHILGYRVGRELYRQAYTGRPPLGMFNPPDCQSLDRQSGHGLGHRCDGCAFRGGRRSCKVRGYLLFLPEGEQEPILVLVPRSSFDATSQALDELKRWGRTLATAPVVLAVQPDTSARGRQFGRVWIREEASGPSEQSAGALGLVLEGLGRIWFGLLDASLAVHRPRKPVELEPLAQLG